MPGGPPEKPAASDPDTGEKPGQTPNEVRAHVRPALRELTQRAIAALRV